MHILVLKKFLLSCLPSFLSLSFSFSFLNFLPLFLRILKYSVESCHQCCWDGSLAVNDFLEDVILFLNVISLRGQKAVKQLCRGCVFIFWFQM